MFVSNNDKQCSVTEAKTKDNNAHNKHKVESMAVPPVELFINSKINPQKICIEEANSNDHTRRHKRKRERHVRSEITAVKCGMKKAVIESFKRRNARQQHSPCRTVSSPNTAQCA